MVFPAFSRANINNNRARLCSKPPYPELPRNGDPGFRLSVFWTRDDQSTISDHPATTPTDLVRRLEFALANVLLFDGTVLGQFWAAVPYGPAWVLTTLDQPFGLTEDTTELWSYRMASLSHRYYVNGEKNVGIGLPGRVFQKRVPEWTPNVQKYSKEEYPWLDDAVNYNICGSWAVPVIEHGKCVGVLEFVTTATKQNFDYEIVGVCKALEAASLQTSNLEEIVKHNISLPCLKRRRRTASSYITYNDLAQCFGLHSADAAKSLRLIEGTFRNVCRRLNVHWWPYDRFTAKRAIQLREGQIGTALLGPPFAEIPISASNLGFAEEVVGVSEIGECSAYIPISAANEVLAPINSQLRCSIPQDPIAPLHQMTSPDFGQMQQSTGFGVVPFQMTPEEEYFEQMHVTTDTTNILNTEDLPLPEFDFDMDIDLYFNFDDFANFRGTKNFAAA